jgi:uncharacterized glyoxalase superfamily protein PhnB
MSKDQTPTADIHPCLFYDDAPGAIAWLCRAFGFKKRLVISGEGETVMHSELSLGNGVIMVASSKSDEGRVGPRNLGGRANQALSVFVADPDAHHAQAIDEGAEVVRALRDEEYGARGYMAKDLEGHSWYFGNYRPGAHWDAE